ncbi:MAG: GtrA family protein [Nitrososphaerales archaeon]
MTEKLNLPVVSKFAMVSGIGFLVSEAILTVEVLAFYHATKVPGVASASVTILGMDVVAFGVGVTVAFFLNERFTAAVPDEQRARDGKSVLFRWAKYQLVALLGNAIIIGVQLALLGEFSLSPLAGVIIGAAISFPVSYVVSMRLVWGVNPLRGRPRALR